ncbi:LOW QUALITY PROTEIN: hypothetical protein IFM46972_10705 [Aspergillus udagawae]|uniref:Uncharacterized protein n=1 Tax=Aspergillus udagawae TaxID=91492 RepID=A0A8H3SE45_9EURO|nr:LOW QUALITY PROTEIN: hypothetical protein IFM46972_10705 [Aspergillus udagawae]
MRPELCVRARLQRLPDPVPADIQPAAAAEADVVEELPERQDPVLGPGFLLLRGEPPADADDGAGRGRVLVCWGGAVFGDVDGGVAVEAVEEVGR